MNFEEKEAYTLRMVREKKWRIVLNSRRAKKLRDRGEGIAWNSCINGWVWDWQYRVKR